MSINISMKNATPLSLKEYIKNHAILIKKPNGEEMMTPGEANGKIKHILLKPQTIVPSNTADTELQQTIRIAAGPDGQDELGNDQWANIIANLFKTEQVSYHQAGMMLEEDQQTVISAGNTLFGGSHSFYHFRLKEYENLSRTTPETSLPSYLEGQYFEMFQTLTHAKRLFYRGPGNTGQFSYPRPVMVEQYDSCNTTLHLFSPQLFKTNTFGYNSAGLYNINKNYFYRYVTDGVTLGTTDARKKENVFVMFPMPSNSQAAYSKMLHVPFFNIIEIQQVATPIWMSPSGPIKGDKFRELFSSMEWQELLMSMLKNNLTDSIQLRTTGDSNNTQFNDVVTYPAVDFYEALAEIEPDDIDAPDELFLYDDNFSMLDSGVMNHQDWIAKLVALKGGCLPLDEDMLFDFETLFSKDFNCYTEVVAFRVIRTGANNSRQAFYFLNHDSMINFFDTQVQFKTSYNYRVSLYLLIYGMQIGFKDRLVTKTNEDGDIAWFDMETGAEDHNATVIDPGQYGPYQAQATLSVTPDIKIIPIDIYQKQLKIVEPPPVEPMVRFQNVSTEKNKIKISIEDPIDINVFKNDLKPLITFEASEQTYYEDLKRYCYTPNIYSSFVASDSVFEVFRMEEKPTSIIDFSDYAYDVIESSEVDGFGDRDRLATMFDFLVHQKKYYYLFRTRTHNGNVSNPSPIYVVEKFQDADETILKVETMEIEAPKDYSMDMDFRRFLKIEINDRHLVVGQDTYEKPLSAKSNIDNISIGELDEEGIIDQIWKYNGQMGHKYIKLRLESKNTGKKIDLNLYFKIKKPPLPP